MRATEEQPDIRLRFARLPGPRGWRGVDRRRLGRDPAGL